MNLPLYFNRIFKVMLTTSCAVFMTIVVFNHIQFYSVNFEYLQHIMRMDSLPTMPEYMWRAIEAEPIHHACYGFVILCETIAAGLLWLGAWQMFKNRKMPTQQFEHEKLWSINGLSFSLLIYILLFYAVGSEWFVSWQSSLWNAKKAALPILCMIGFCLIYLNQPEKG